MVENNSQKRTIKWGGQVKFIYSFFLINSMKKRERKHDLHHKSFWVSIAFLFVLSFLVLVNSSGPTVTGNTAIQTIAYMKAGSELDFEVRNVNSVKQVTVAIQKDVKNAVIQLEEIDTPSWEFQGTVLSKFRISSPDGDKFSQFRFLLKVMESDLHQSNLNPDEIVLYHEGRGLETSVVEQKEEAYYFEAVSSGMGDFVLGKADVPVQNVVEPVTSESLPVEEQTPAPATPLKKLTVLEILVKYFKKFLDSFRG